MKDALDKKTMRDEYDDNYQGQWIRYHEMELLYLFLIKSYKKAIVIADNLLQYKFRTKSLSYNAYRYIKNKCEAAIDTGIVIDSSFKSDYDNFRKKSIWI